jgi:hypothetical protein
MDLRRSQRTTRAKRQTNAIGAPTDTYVRRGKLTLGLGPSVTFIRLSGDARGEEQLPG